MPPIYFETLSIMQVQKSQHPRSNPYFHWIVLLISGPMATTGISIFELNCRGARH